MNVKTQVITQLSVTNVDDDPDNPRVMSFTVEADWWAKANNVSRELLWRGLLDKAQAVWSAQDVQLIRDELGAIDNEAMDKNEVAGVATLTTEAPDNVKVPA